jgi:hypothetical protein
LKIKHLSVNAGECFFLFNPQCFSFFQGWFFYTPFVFC